MSSSSNTAPGVPTKPVAAVRNVAVSFEGQLDDGELLTGTPTAVPSPTSGAPTVTNAAVTAVGKKINGRMVPTGKAVTFKVSGGTAGVLYTFTVTCGTTAEPAQTLIGYTKLRVQNS